MKPLEIRTEIYSLRTIPWACVLGYIFPKLEVLPGSGSILRSQAWRFGISEKATLLKKSRYSFRVAGRVPFSIGGEEGSTKERALA